MSKINVLVFPAGEVNSVELHDALSTCVNIELLGVSSIDRHGSYVFKNYISNVPLINEADFIDKFNEILLDKKIDVIFPTHDTVAKFFADNQDKIKAKIICADKYTADICRDKKKIYELFKDENFCPEVYPVIDKYPVFIKPRDSQGGIGAKLIKSKEDIPLNINLENYVICEYLDGVEYTVDCLTDKYGKLRYVSPRSRKRIFAGISASGEVEKLTSEIEKIADIINSKLNFKGLWWFQIKQDKNKNWKLLEISTRCAGTMALTRAKGVNLPLLSVYVAMGYDISIEPNDYSVKMDSTLIRRYKIDYEYDTVYFDYDDTLIIDNKVYLPAIRFLYQCKNKDKKIILLTKHDNDLKEDMLQHCISLELFDKIIELDMNESKADYIKPESAIFIDNAFKERAEVKKRHNIPVFDVDGIEFLLDWRK